MLMRRSLLRALLCGIMIGSLGRADAPAAPPAAGTMLDAQAVAAIDRLVANAVSAGTIPGAQIIVIAPPHGHIALRKAYGVRTLEPHAIANDLTTIYEIASLTKGIATTSAIMLLVQRGQLRLRDRVGAYIPEFAQHQKGRVTIEQLLLHTSGLPPAFERDDYNADRVTILAHTYGRKLDFAPGTGFQYSNIGFIVLAEIVARVAHAPFETYVRRELFGPLGMHDATFDTTIDAARKTRLAPQIENQTEQRLRDAFGTVPGVNGHAGMLATADDIAAFAHGLLLSFEGGLHAASPFAQATLEAMREPHYVGGGDVRGLGWDVDSGFSGNRGDLLPRGGFGHTGSSGTSLWIDPALGTAVIFLSNAHYPKDVGSTLPLEAKIANIVAAALPYDREKVALQQARFGALAARSAAGFPATPLPAPTPSAPPSPSG